MARGKYEVPRRSPLPGSTATELPRAVPGPGEGVVVLTYWRPWRHLPRRQSYGSPAFRVGGNEFMVPIHDKRFLRPVEERVVPVAVPAGLVEVQALEPPHPRREQATVARTRLYCEVGQTLHLEFVPPNNAEVYEGSFQLPGQGPGRRFYNNSLLVAPLLAVLTVPLAIFFYQHIARESPAEVLPSLFPPGKAASVLLLFCALTLASLVTGIWAGLRPRGPFRKLRTPETEARAAATAAAIARAGRAR